LYKKREEMRNNFLKQEIKNGRKGLPLGQEEVNLIKEI